MRPIEIKLRESYTITDSVIERVLRLRGVKKKDIKHYLFPSDAIKPDYKKLKNINKGVDMLKHHIDNKSKILLIIDPDFDGVCSSGIMYQFLVNDLEYPSDLVEYFVPYTKKHGIPEEFVLEKMPDLLITPDSASSEVDIHKRLSEHNINIICPDHHIVEGEESEFAVIINNQISPDFPWKSLTGTNITHLFCEAYNDTYMNGKIDTNRYISEAAFGMVADRANLTDVGVFWYLSQASKSIHNPLIKQIIEKSNNISSEDTITSKNIGFEIAPFFNAMFRSGHDEDLHIVVDALFGLNYEVYNSRLKDNFPVKIEAQRKMSSTRQRQSKQTKEALEKIEERIKETGSDKNKILLVNSTGIIEDAGLNGLTAIRLATQYKKPTLVMQYYPDEGVLKGSGRGIEDSSIGSFKELLEETELFEYVRGHDFAFGISITLENAYILPDVLNEMLEDVETGSLEHTVDLSYSRTPVAEDIMAIAQNSLLWGAGTEEPLVYVSDIEIPKSGINFIGKKGNVLKIDLGTVEAIMFSLTEEQKLRLTAFEEDIVAMEIVASCSINEYRGQKRPQLIIKDFDARGLSPEEQNPFGGMDIEVLPF